MTRERSQVKQLWPVATSMTECNVVTGISAADFGILRPLARLGSGPCNTNITYEYDSEREKRPLSNAS